MVSMKEKAQCVLWYHETKSPVTPLDFLLWGYVKDKVFSTPVPDITNLKARITDAFSTITEDMLRTCGEKLIID